MKLILLTKKELFELNDLVQNEIYNTEKAIREHGAGTDARVNNKKVNLINVLKKI